MIAQDIVEEYKKVVSPYQSEDDYEDEDEEEDEESVMEDESSFGSGDKRSRSQVDSLGNRTRLSGACKGHWSKEEVRFKFFSYP